MEALEIKPISKKIDEVSLLISLRNLSTEILLDREQIIDATVSEEFKHRYVHNQIIKRNKLKSILKDLVKEIENTERIEKEGKPWKH